MVGFGFKLRHFFIEGECVRRERSALCHLSLVVFTLRRLVTNTGHAKAHLRIIKESAVHSRATAGLSLFFGTTL